MQTTTIQRLGQQGDGIDENGNFAPFSLPQEVVTGLLSGDKIDVKTITNHNPHRITPVCKHFGTCGGCSVQHASDAFLADWKREIVQRALLSHGLEAEIRACVVTPPHTRRRAVFSGRRTKKTTQVGFHARGSEALFNIEECPLMLAEVLAALPACHELVKVGASRKGEVKLSVTHSRTGPDIAVSQGKPLDGPLRAILANVAERFGVARLNWNGETVAGRHPAIQRFGNVDVIPPSGAFLQATTFGEQTLVEAVTTAITGASRIADLFSGCGTFSLPLAQIAEVHAVESSAEMLAALDKGWRFAAGLKTVTTEVRDLFRRPLVPLDLKKIDAVVVDPPRAGAKAQMQELVNSNVPLVAAVSCNPATFARDAKILIDGGFTLNWVLPVDQFRWSGHVEMVAKFSR